jgi:hypothetical protein
MMDFEFDQISIGKNCFNLLQLDSDSNEEEYKFEHSKIPSINSAERSDSISLLDSVKSSSYSKSSIPSKSIDILRLDQLARIIIIPILKQIVYDINLVFSAEIYKTFKKDIKFSEFSNKKIKKFCISQKSFPLIIQKTPFELFSEEKYFDCGLKFKQEKIKIDYLLQLEEFKNKESRLFELLNSPLLISFSKYLNDINYLKNNLKDYIPKINEVFDYLLKRDIQLRRTFKQIIDFEIFEIY